MHPKLVKTVGELNLHWHRCLDKAFKTVTGMMAERAPQYEQFTPVWFRLPRPEFYLTLMRIKMDRIESEFEHCKGDIDEWNPDNAIDLVAYALFLIAFKSFITTPSDPPPPEIRKHPLHYDHSKTDSSSIEDDGRYER